MAAVCCILLVLALAIPLRWAVLRQEHAASPEFFRRHGLGFKGMKCVLPP